MIRKTFRRSFLIFALLTIALGAFAQSADSTKIVTNVEGTLTVTNKGISTIPNFTLGKPATILFMSIGRKIRFEPEFRFALEGKPWMFIFWWRCYLVKTDKFLTRLGANPTFAFRTMPLARNGVTADYSVSYRTLTADLSSYWLVAGNVSLGTYYMYVYGVEDFATRNTHYLALRTSFSSIRISEQYFLKFNPQVYYLNMDKIQGFYFTSTLSLNKRKFPFYLSAMVNQPLHTDIPIGNKLLWNMSVGYTFSKKYTSK